MQLQYGANGLNLCVRQRNLMTGCGLVIHGKRLAQNTCYL